MIPRNFIIASSHTSKYFCNVYIWSGDTLRIADVLINHTHFNNITIVSYRCVVIFCVPYHKKNNNEKKIYCSNWIYLCVLYCLSVVWWFITFALLYALHFHFQSFTRRWSVRYNPKQQLFHRMYALQQYIDFFLNSHFKRHILEHVILDRNGPVDNWAEESILSLMHFGTHFCWMEENTFNFEFN